MRQPRYNYIQKLIDRITKSGQSNNDSFTYYGHLVELQSGANGYVSVTLYKTDDRYGGELADFSFDYWTLELHFVGTVGKTLTEKIISAFRHFTLPEKSVSLMTKTSMRTRTRPMSMTRRIGTSRP